ncbi:Small integral membrane protein 12-A [Orchesella cincta]|uniref:Small integral membrane protein 12-A n=1 Tax=Orchesella cincta TaxID=48709 RepID=A0A1D2MKC7_ORCCI|nr:Small integral membrane protein 12-A [Orchesella cincta]
MFPAIWAVLRAYAPVITLPAAALVGIIGYALENIISDKYTPYKESIEEQRGERLLQEVDSGKLVDKLEEKKFVPKSIFERNLSPQLRKDVDDKHHK